jgi:hypothetical protein
VFADTNVYLHCKFFDEVDWRECCDGNEAILTVPPVVVRELEKHKFGNPSPRVRARAQGVVRKLGQLVEDDTPVVLREGCKLLMTAAEPQIDFVEAALSKDLPDDVLLAAALEHSRAGHKVVVLSGDGGVRLKAKTRKMEQMDVPDEWQLPEEADEREKEIAKLRRENEKLKEKEPRLKLIIGGEKNAEFVITYPPPTAVDKFREAVQQKKEERQKTWRPMRVQEHGILLVDPDDAREYNKKLEEHWQELDKYRDEYAPAFWSKMLRTIGVELQLENGGAASAEDVDVIVTAAAEGRWRLRKPTPKDLPDPPEAPQNPFVRGGFRTELNPLMNSNLRGIRSIHAPRANVVGRKVNLSKPQEVRFHVGLIKPGPALKLPMRHFEFAKKIASLKLSYQLVGKNLRAPQSGTINIRFTVVTAEQDET